MRLIDADKLVDMMYDNEYTTLCPLDEVSGVIDNCPTVDAVPVVRCRDCAHLYGSLCAACGLLLRKPDEFCSRGERKDGADHAAD